MGALTIYHIALVGHIIGLTMMAGTTLADSMVFNQFWKQFVLDRQKANAIGQVSSKFQILFGSGFLLLIISGVCMMAITHGVFGEQTWFRIKFGLIVLILINGLTMGRRNGVQLRKLLRDEIPGGNVQERFLKIKRNLRIFHISQMTLFAIIFTLSVFKFN